MKKIFLFFIFLSLLACNSEETEQNAAKMSELLPLSEEEKEAEVFKNQFRWGFINKKGKFVIDAQFEEVGNFQEGLCPIKQNNLWGFINNRGVMVVQPKYKTVWGFKEDYARVLNHDNLIGFIDKKGKEIIKPQYSNANDFTDFLAVVELDNRYYHINKKNQKLYKEGYRFADDFVGNKAIVETDKGYGVILSQGVFIIPPKYKELKWVDSKLLAFKEKRKWGILEQDTTVRVEAIFDEIGMFENGLTYVVQDELYGLMDAFGEFIIEPKYTQIWYAGMGNWTVITEDSKHGIVDSDGEIILPIEYDQVLRFQEERAGIMKNEVWAYINLQGKKITDFEYLLAWSFKEGLARVVTLKGEQFFIDKTGKPQLAIPYNDVRDFHEGLARVQILIEK